MAAAPLVPTPTDDPSLTRRQADFATMTEALDYVAHSNLGMNFHDARATLVRVYPYSELREEALAAARRFVARGIAPGERVALIAETAPEFIALFFGALYVGIPPVPLPLPTSFGGKEAYIEQLSVQLKSAHPALLVYPPDLQMAAGAAEATSVLAVDWATLAAELMRRRRCRSQPPTISPIGIRAARPASRTASSSPTAPCSATSPPTPIR